MPGDLFLRHRTSSGIPLPDPVQMPMPVCTVLSARDSENAAIVWSGRMVRIVYSILSTYAERHAHPFSNDKFTSLHCHEEKRLL